MTTNKLNTKRTMIIGFAFFAILMTWQIYNTYCPIFLTELLTTIFNLTEETQVQYIVGIIMALDNFLAIFMLPIFGALSDKTSSKLGRRMPYILIGILLSIIILPFIPIMYITNSLAGLIIFMLLTVIIMNMYRNPAVSLMPDLTLKKHRTKANGIINFVGYLGAILAGLLGTIYRLENSNETGIDLIKDSAVQTAIPFIVAIVFMLIAALVLYNFIDENKVAKEITEEENKEESVINTENTVTTKKIDKRFILLIIAIFFWFAGFNSVETFFGNFNLYYLNTSTGASSLATNILVVVSLICFIPSSILSNKIGRKWTIVVGLVLLTAGLAILNFLNPETIVDEKLPLFVFLCFGICGAGWAMVNCCSYPMFIEFTKAINNGKVTGWYYTSSMLAQAITSILTGLLFFLYGTWSILFIYASIMMFISLVVFFFVRDTKER